MSINRREFMGRVVGTGLGSLLGLRLAPLFAQEAEGARAKRCILVWLEGGPSHIDTFDPKQGVATVRTKVRGLELSQDLPRLAEQAKRLTVVRSLTSKEGDHARATHFVQTGHVRSETVSYPRLGAVASASWPAHETLPSYVAIGNPDPSSEWGGFLGFEHGPFDIGSEEPAGRLEVPDHLRRRYARRLKLLDSLDQDFQRRTGSPQVGQEIGLGQRARRLLDPASRQAFEVEREPERIRRAYGDNSFGQSCLLARRLIENGVRFAQVQLDGWDTHENNVDRTRELCQVLDPALSSLLQDLADRRLLDETLVICLGEFGRTPRINGENGRDHHSDAFSAVLAGGGLDGGRVIGATDRQGDQVTQRPITIPELHATIYAAAGFDGQRTYETPNGRPITLLDEGVRPVEEILS